MTTLAIGVDVGGSHVCSAACDLLERTYLPETHSEQALDNQGPADEILGIWARTIAETIRKAGAENVKGIGFAMPGPFDYVNGVAIFQGSNRKYDHLHGIHIPAALQSRLSLPEDFPIRFINDATAFAIGEDWMGKARGSKKSLSITLGTGFGSAFLSDGLPVVCGEEVPEMGCVWHLPFENGTADDYFSTRGLLNRYHEKSGIKLAGVKELADRVGSDPVAQALFEDFGEKLGLFLFPWIEKSGVEVLVLGGNISNAFPLFEDKLKTALSARGARIRIAVSELKETASIVGSSVLIDEVFYARVQPLLAYM